MPKLIGLLSDAHGNALAFDRAIDLLLTNGAERLYFLGDAIGYIPSTDVLDSLARLGDRIRCILGNHEAMFLTGQVEPERECVYQLEALRTALTPDQFAMIASWPASRDEVVDGQRLLLVHGSPSNPTYGYTYPDSDLATSAPDADWVVMGNTHHPFIRKQAATCYINVGSCGMPRDDGRYGSVALLDTRARSARILRFDVTDLVRQTLERFPSVHESVRDLFARRCPAVVGELL